MNEITPSWRALLDPVLESEEFGQLRDWLATEEAAGKVIHPPVHQRFAALHLTPPDAVRAVILGQDPYHGAGQAHGLAFSVQRGVKVPPSLRNIFTELESDCLVPRPDHGDLSGWARQGVLLLNTSLSVEEGIAASHAGRGWEALSDAIIDAVASRRKPVAFALWGAHAQKKAGRIAQHHEDSPHLVLSSPHPSPLSAHRGFFGSRPFSRTNAFLEGNGRGTIDWRLT